VLHPIELYQDRRSAYMDYGQTNITVPVSIGSDRYSQMDMRKNKGFGNLVGYGTLFPYYLIFYKDRAMVTSFSETTDQGRYYASNMTYWVWHARPLV